MKIIVFGTTGMLGSMVYSYLRRNPNFSVLGTYHNDANLGKISKQDLFKFDASRDIEEQCNNIIRNFNADYVINCIGIINKYCNTGKRSDVLNAVSVNSAFPLVLSKYFENNSNAKILQIATDCVYNGEKEGYIESDSHNPEDVYGKTKSLGEVNAKNFLNIRCSIIGPEINNYNSLFEWFISQQPHTEVSGYDHHTWNGVTTLQFAQYCEDIIENNLFSEIRNISPIIHYTPNETVTKYMLLSIINNIFNKEVHIKGITNIGRPIYRDLDSEFLPGQIKIKMEDAILDLKEYLENNNEYKTERYFK